MAKSPRFTDLGRYPHGYKPSNDTDITKSWERARKQIEKDKQERAEKVRDIKQLGVKR